MYSDRSICSSCIKNCDSHLKAELAMRGYITNIYLRKGPKITYACRLYSAKKTSGTVMSTPIINTQEFKLPDIKVV